MNDIADILKNRIESFKQNPEKSLKLKGTQYSKDWAKAVKCFVDRINVDRKKEKQPNVTFMQVRQKLVGVKEIDDLRFFYKMCLEYKYKKKGNTFSKCFWGATKIK